MNWLREQLEVAAAETSPSRKRQGAMPFLPRTDTPRRARVFVTDDETFDEALTSVLAELDGVRGSMARVVPLEPVRGFGICSLGTPELLARLAAPLVGVASSRASDGISPPCWAYEPPGYAAAERFMTHAAAYGCEHVTAHAGHLDPEAWAIELTRATRLTDDTPGAYLDLADAAVESVKRHLLLSAAPLVVIPVDLVTEIDPRWVRAIDRASRVLAHERVVFVTYCLQPMLRYQRKDASASGFHVDPSRFASEFSTRQDSQARRNGIDE